MISQANLYVPLVLAKICMIILKNKILRYLSSQMNNLTQSNESLLLAKRNECGCDVAVKKEPSFKRGLNALAFNPRLKLGRPETVAQVGPTADSSRHKRASVALKFDREL